MDELPPLPSVEPLRRARSQRDAVSEEALASWQRREQLQMHQEQLSWQVSDQAVEDEQIELTDDQRDEAVSELARIEEELAAANRQSSDDQARLEKVEARLRHEREQLAAALDVWHAAMQAAGPQQHERAAALWGGFVAGWRDAEGLTMRQAANVLDVSSATIARYEHHERRPSLVAVGEHIERMTARVDLADPAWDHAWADHALTTEEHEEQLTGELERLTESARQLAAPQRQVLLALAAAPDALDALQRIVEATDPIRTAIDHDPTH